jgi:XapX domain-containing protein
MKVYLLSLSAGVLVGIIYSLMHVRSPAPPLVALVGLLGILGGEQIIPVSKHLLFGSPVSAAPHESSDAACVPGMLPGGRAIEQASRKNGNAKEKRS